MFTKNQIYEAKFRRSGRGYANYYLKAKNHLKQKGNMQKKNNKKNTAQKIHVIQ